MEERGQLMDFSENSYYRTILDTIPNPVLVVDADVRIRDMNAAALQFCGQKKKPSIDNAAAKCCIACIRWMFPKDAAEGRSVRTA